MSFPFHPTGPAILVEAILIGPRRAVSLSLTLDTGATRTVIRPHFLTSAGYELSSGRVLRMRSTTGRSDTRLVPISRLDALGVTKTGFELAAHDLPVGVLTDGLLGLDFLRSHVLTLDFARGRMRLRPPGWWHFWR